MLYGILKSMVFFSTFDLSNKTKEITQFVLTPFVCISWIIFVFLLLDLYNKIYLPDNIIITNSMIYICIETFWYTICTIIWKCLLTIYQNKVTYFFDNFIKIVSCNNFKIHIYEFISIFIIFLSYLNTKLYIFISSFYIIISVIYTRILKINIESINKNLQWNILCNKITNGIDSSTISNTVFLHFYNFIYKNKTVLIQNNSVVPIDIISNTIEENTIDEIKVELIHNDVSKIIKPKKILYYNISKEGDWEILTETSTTNLKYVKCKYNINSDTILHLSDFAIIFNNFKDYNKKK